MPPPVLRDVNLWGGFTYAGKRYLRLPPILVLDRGFEVITCATLDPLPGAFPVGRGYVSAIPLDTVVTPCRAY